MFRILVVLAVSLISATLCAAHITDQLVVGLYAQADASGEPLHLLSSGAPVEVLERQAGFVRVKLADQREGWIESVYVTEEKPARAKLLETQARLRQTGLELAALRQAAGVEPATIATSPPSAREAELRQALGKAEARVAELKKKLGEQQASVEAQQRLEVVQQRVREALTILADSQNMTLLVDGPSEPLDLMTRYQAWIVGLAALVLGFAAGILFIDHRIRKRYGGFRI